MHPLLIMLQGVTQVKGNHFFVPSLVSSLYMESEKPAYLLGWGVPPSHMTAFDSVE